MISTKGRYALRVMVDLAEQNADSYIPLSEIAARQEISEKYLEIILTPACKLVHRYHKIFIKFIVFLHAPPKPVCLFHR